MCNYIHLISVAAGGWSNGYTDTVEASIVKYFLPGKVMF
jgi:hypothetical protein